MFFQKHKESESVLRLRLKRNTTFSRVSRKVHGRSSSFLRAAPSSFRRKKGTFLHPFPSPACSRRLALPAQSPPRSLGTPLKRLNARCGSLAGRHRLSDLRTLAGEAAKERSEELYSTRSLRKMPPGFSSQAG